MDVTKPETIKSGIERIYSEHGRIDVLINNAGLGFCGALELTTEEEAACIMNINFLGVVNMCRIILPYMRKLRKGKIVNISSIAGIIAAPYQGLYSASKFAIEGYSAALAIELYPFNIKVCVIEPGDFNTGFTTNRILSQNTLKNIDYSTTFKDTLRIIEEAERTGCTPNKLGHVICHIVESKNPPFCTITGPKFQIFMAKIRRWIPNKLMQFILRKVYQI